MPLATSTVDRQAAIAAETAIKTALTEGASSLSPALIPAAAYTPAEPYQDTTRDANRCIAVGVVQGLRAAPMQLAVYTVAQLPTAATTPAGCLVFCSNAGPSSAGRVCFSDGANWRRIADNVVVA